MRRSTIYLIVIVIVSSIAFIYGLGDILYYSKGEPREALVASSMLETGNWILPLLDGVDLPYKPPMLAWLVAIYSSVTAGHVTEFASRLPSAIAMIFLLVVSYLFFRKKEERGGSLTAFLTAMIMMAMIETHRAAIVCRVDMLLTLFIFTAIVSLYRWKIYKNKWYLIFAVLSMSCATLTKGPVGIILPCLIVGVYELVEGEKWWKLLLRFIVISVSALIIPAIYYYFAYLQGGKPYLDLVIEENFGRFIGSMCYGSHIHPFWYNFVSLLVGTLPYTIFLIFSLFAFKYSLPKKSLKGFWLKFKQGDPFVKLSTIAIVVTVVFYCVPASKRSVYLLPVYPFVAYLIANLMCKLRKRHSHVIKRYNVLLMIVGIVAIAVFEELYFNLCNQRETILSLSNNLLSPIMENDLSAVDYFFIVSPLVVIGYALSIRRRPTSDNHLYALVSLSLAIYLSVSVAFIRPILNEKSDYYKASCVANIAPTGRIFASIKDPNMRFYTIDFYLRNRVKPVPYNAKGKLSGRGLILLNENEAKEFLSSHTQNKFSKIWRSVEATPKTPKSCDSRQSIVLYSFK